MNKKTVLILGSSSGLGLSIAQAFDTKGYQVAVVSRDIKRAEKACESMTAAHPFAADLDKVNAGYELVSEVQHALGSIDIVITNTGPPPSGDFIDLTLEDWDLGYQRIFRSAIEIVHAVLPSMIQRGFGRVIMSLSTAAKEPVPKLTISTGFRAGLLGLMKILSQQVADKQVTVNAILPGFTKTEHMAHLLKENPSLIDDVPAKRLGLPEEFASLAVYLASEEAAFLTGQAIAVDGGLIKGI